MASAGEFLPSATLKLIGDPRYEKRKAAALEVEQVVKRLAAAQDHARVRALVDRLIADFAFSPQANHRKGALLCLAAAAVGLGDAPGGEQHLRQIVPPILASFTDQDARVRYYACEALYNVGKSAREGFVEFFPEVFDATFRLCADPEPNVQSAVQFLDSLVKDIVTASPSFRVGAVVPKLRDYLKVLNPYKRQFLVSWVSVLDSVPDLDVLSHLPALLDGLMSMLSDPNREIRAAVHKLLMEFLCEAQASIGESGGGGAVVAAAAAPAAPAAAATPHWQSALDEIANKASTGRLVVVQIAPAVRVAISEALGKAPGAVKTGQLVAALRRLGFDRVFDTLFGADLTIMEEGTELLERLTAHLEQAKREREAAAGHGDAAAASAPPPPMPMFTSCCPGWIAMVEKSNPELIPYLSTCKSPQMMFGAVIKNYFAATAGLRPDQVVSCSLMPCVRKQGEADRPWFSTAAPGVRDVDHVMTTVEIAKILQEKNIDPETLPEEEFDNDFTGSGGGQLFGTTGGVMEAALRTVAEVVSGKRLDRVVYDEVRGMEGVREATLTLQPGEGTPFYALMQQPAAAGEAAAPPPPPLELRVAVANGLGNAKKLIKAMADGTAKYDFVEVMACPGGCVSGGGQPRSADKSIAQKRQSAIFALDERAKIRRPHENAYLQQLYANFLEKPGGHKAHELLHTHYVPGGVEGGGKDE